MDIPDALLNIAGFVLIVMAMWTVVTMIAAVAWLFRKRQRPLTREDLAELMEALVVSEADARTAAPAPLSDDGHQPERVAEMWRDEELVAAASGLGALPEAKVEPVHRRPVKVRKNTKESKP